MLLSLACVHPSSFSTGIKTLLAALTVVVTITVGYVHWKRLSVIEEWLKMQATGDGEVGVGWSKGGVEGLACTAQAYQAERMEASEDVSKDRVVVLRE